MKCILFTGEWTSRHALWQEREVTKEHVTSPMEDLDVDGRLFLTAVK